LAEIFEYASTVKDINYPKYFAYAGLDIDVQPREIVGAYLGVAIREQSEKPVISSVEWDSPAWRAGLSIQDEIIALDGAGVTSRAVGDVINQKKPGDRVKVLVLRGNVTRELEVILGKKTERSFQIRPMAHPTPLQAAILKGWLKD
jgi:predicted metalloprotease with PDZ domain